MTGWALVPLIKFHPIVGSPKAVNAQDDSLNDFSATSEARLDVCTQNGLGQRKVAQDTRESPLQVHQWSKMEQAIKVVSLND